MPKKIGPRLQPLLKNVDYAALRSQAQQIQKEGDDIIMEVNSCEGFYFVISGSI